MVKASNLKSVNYFSTSDRDAAKSSLTRKDVIC